MCDVEFEVMLMVCLEDDLDVESLKFSVDIYVKVKNVLL